MATTQELNAAYEASKTPPKSYDEYSTQISSAAKGNNFAQAAQLENERNGLISSGQMTGKQTSQYSGYTPYEAQVFKPATSQADSINAYYDQYIESQKQAEQSAYDETIRALEYESTKLSPAYKAQREALAAEREIADRNFRQSALASGINTGAGSQYALASGNAYQSNMTTLRQAEAQALADVEESRRQTTASYQNAIAKAISDGNLARAQALYQEAVRVDESIVLTAQAQAQENYNAWQAQYTANRAGVEDALTDYNKNLQRAETLAQYGDFSGYAALGYTSSQIAAMKALWNKQNNYGYGYSSGGSGSSGSSSKSSKKEDSSKSGSDAASGDTYTILLNSVSAARKAGVSANSINSDIYSYLASSQITEGQAKVLVSLASGVYG